MIYAASKSPSKNPFLKNEVKKVIENLKKTEQEADRLEKKLKISASERPPRSSAALFSAKFLDFKNTRSADVPGRTWAGRATKEGRLNIRERRGARLDRHTALKELVLLMGVSVLESVALSKARLPTIIGFLITGVLIGLTASDSSRKPMK